MNISERGKNRPILEGKGKGRNPSPIGMPVQDVRRGVDNNITIGEICRVDNDGSMRSIIP